MSTMKRALRRMFQLATCRACTDNMISTGAYA